MNSGKSVVLTKEKSLISRIISTLIVFSVTCILACGVVVGLYFAFPSKVSPILQKFGVVSKKVEATKVNRIAAVQQEPKSALEITLNEEDWQRLRSTDIIILPMDKGDGFRILSPPEKKRGLNDQDLEAIVPLSGKILSLDLTHAEISDEGLKVLSKLSSLQRLYLEGNKEITVDGLAHLKSLENLTYLNLVRIELNEELVDLLISMKSLREIYLYDTGLNEESITRLTDARPKVFVNGG
jgi:Leucine-rich repeat (LRR) protein